MLILAELLYYFSNILDFTVYVHAMSIACPLVTVRWLDTPLLIERIKMHSLLTVIITIQEFAHLSQVEKESDNFARQLIGVTSEEEALHILNEHNHRMNIIEARNELSKAEQLESFRRKFNARQKNKRVPGAQEVFFGQMFYSQLNHASVL